MIRLSAPDPAVALTQVRQAVTALRSDLAVLESSLSDLEAAAGRPSPSSTLLTVDEAASELRVSRSTVFGLIRTGELATTKIGSRRLVPRASLEALVARRAA